MINMRDRFTHPLTADTAALRFTWWLVWAVFDVPVLSHRPMIQWKLYECMIKYYHDNETIRQ